MYSTSIINENRLSPDHLTHMNSPQEAVIELLPNLSQIEAEMALLCNIRTGTPSPPPRSPGTNNTDQYAEWDPSPSPAREVRNATTTMQPPGPQEPPALTFTNAHGTRVSIRLPTPRPPQPLQDNSPQSRRSGKPVQIGTETNGHPCRSCSRTSIISHSRPQPSLKLTKIPMTSSLHSNHGTED